MRSGNSQIGYLSSGVADKILILEDTAARVDEMRAVMLELLPNFELVVFDNVPDLSGVDGRTFGRSGADLSRSRFGCDAPAG
jgi:hypothetical protein